MTRAKLRISLGLFFKFSSALNQKRRNFKPISLILLSKTHLFRQKLAKTHPNQGPGPLPPPIAMPAVTILWPDFFLVFT